MRGPFCNINAETIVVIKHPKNIIVAHNLVSLNILLHCLLKPIRNPVPANDIIFPRVYNIENVPGLPVANPRIENVDNIVITKP